MNKRTAVTTCAVLLLFLFGAAVLNLLTPAKSFSELENRPLQERPDFSVEGLVSGKFTQQFETYLTDQFWARDAWVGIKYLAERALLKTENNGVYFARDGRLLERFDPPSPDRVAGNLNAVRQIAEKTGLPVTFALAPTSAYVYQDLLPWGAPTYNQQELLDAAARELPDLYLDLSETLLSHRDEEIFYRTDHHWTTYGAYLAYRSIAWQMGLEPIALPENGVEVPGFYGTLFSQGGVRLIEPDTITYYPMDNLTVTGPEGENIPLYDLEYAEKKDKYSIFLSGNHPICVVRNRNFAGEGRLILVKDSFSNSLVPFLAQHFAEIHLIDPRYYKLPLQDYAAKQGINRVLVLYQTANFVQDASILFLSK